MSMPRNIPIIEKSRDETNTPRGYTEYIFRAPRGEVFIGENRVNLLGIRHSSLFLVCDGNSLSRCSTYYGEPSTIFVKDGSPVDPAIFTLTLPEETLHE
jgi:hypothetical protein